MVISIAVYFFMSSKKICCKEMLSKEECSESVCSLKNTNKDNSNKVYNNKRKSEHNDNESSIIPLENVEDYSLNTEGDMSISFGDDDTFLLNDD